MPALTTDVIRASHLALVAPVDQSDWSAKHRPTSLSAIALADRLRARLDGLASQPKLPHHLLLSGPTGVGKTRIAHSLAQAYFGDSLPARMLDVDGSADQGAAQARVIVDLMQTQGGLFRCADSDYWGLIIIDEGDRLPRKAQQALTGPMQHFRASIRVVITTNNASRLIPSLRSRCRPIAVSPPPVSERVRVLAQLALAEGLEYDEEALAAFAEPFHDLRQMIYAAQAWALEQGSLRVAPSSDGGGWDHGSGQIVLPLGDRP